MDTSGGYVTTLLTSLPFRIIVAMLGVPLFGVALVLLPAAMINLPDSWLGVVELTYCMCCAVAAIRYFSSKRRWLLAFILPAVSAVTVLLFNFATHV
jgi:hypothetical protein